MSETRIRHGGNLDEARQLFPEAPEPWVDLSTGINPVPYPLPELPPSLLERLPSPSTHFDLESAAAEAYGAADAATVVAAPGTQVLISLLPFLRSHSQVAVLAPTYAEHGQAWRKAGHEVADVSSFEDATDSDVCVLVNPNNPDGRLIRRQMLLSLAESLHRRGGWLVIDEAFADFDAGETLIPLLPENAIILRSFGKTYGLAGLRLGFAVAAKSTATKLRTALGPWAVSGPAIEVGRRALRDAEWRVAAERARSADAQRLDALLASVVDKAPRGTTLYRLIESRYGPELFSHLGRHGIWVRRFDYDPKLLRFGLPGPDWAWSRLNNALVGFSGNWPQPVETKGLLTH
jgi:cobalamin biosynthesis protein CobC